MWNSDCVNGSVPVEAVLPLTAELLTLSVPAFEIPPPLLPVSAGQLRSKNGGPAVPVHPVVGTPETPPVMVRPPSVSVAPLATLITCTDPPPLIVELDAPAPLMIVVVPALNVSVLDTA